MKFRTPVQKIAALLLVLTSASPINAPAQNRTKMKQVFGAPANKNREVCEVLDDSQVRDGGYELTHEGKPFIKGFYRMGKKDSTWTFYNKKGVLVSRKKYSKDSKVGIWEFFSYDGNLEWTYNCDADVFDYSRAAKIDSTHLIYQDDKGDWIHDRQKKGPVALRSHAEYATLLTNTFHYPATAVKNNEQGEVVICIIIDENGNGGDYSVAKFAGPDLDTEALNCVKSIPGDYLPAKLNGKKVKAKVFQVFEFRQGN